MINFKRNNLDNSSSPYLQQHKDNPIHWQEWNKETLKYAEQEKKKIFVSIGYATCHWCHVMAAEAFKNKEIADFLNKHFVSIKIDREQRPDIDQYFMDFIMSTRSEGGWPLNVFLMPDKKPILALTYIPTTRKYGIPAFIDIVRMIKEQETAYEYKEQENKEHSIEEESIIKHLTSSADQDYGGFGYMHKFPPHCTLLFMLTLYEEKKTETLKKLIEKTIDAIANRGLHDHLQGGFFRYCVDRQWTIPHFEKMLYDQALLLWVYSAAYKIFKKEKYKKIVEGIIACLEETFEDNGLFYSAHDADTNHGEGSTYLWTKKEIKEKVTEGEWKKWDELYKISEEGNFEGKNHLVKRIGKTLPLIEQKLLEIRKKREQPFIDKKHITSWNALTGIGLIMAYRCTGNKRAFEKAENVVKRLIEKHYKENKLFHSSHQGKIQKEEFLEDYAALLVLMTFLYEETGKYKDILKSLSQKVQEYKKEKWMESNCLDFIKVAAKSYDNPTPSSIALAEFGLLRMKILFNDTIETIKYKEPTSHGFHNITTIFSSGKGHIIHSPEKLDWGKLPLNTIQIRAKRIQECYKTMCKEFETKEEVYDYFKQEVNETLI
jgi:uncharacterized protein